MPSRSTKVFHCNTGLSANLPAYIIHIGDWTDASAVFSDFSFIKYLGSKKGDYKFSFHKVLGTWKIWLQKFFSFYTTFGLKKSWLLNPSKNFIKFLLLSTWSIEIVITDSKQNFFNSLQNAYGKKIAFWCTFSQNFFNLTQGIWEQKLLIFLFIYFFLHPGNRWKTEKFTILTKVFSCLHRGYGNKLLKFTIIKKCFFTPSIGIWGQIFEIHVFWEK